MSQGMPQLKIGLVGFFHNNARDDEAAFSRAGAELAALGDAHAFDLHIVRRKIFNEDDAIAAVRELNDEAVDFTLLLAASVVNGRAVVPFGRLNGRLGIWSLPESTSSGFLPMNSFCGSMIFSGILGQYLADSHIKFKWFYGYCDHPLFGERFEITVQALRAVKSLASSRIGCIGPLVAGFDHLAVSEAQIESLFGARIGRDHSIEEVVRLAKAVPESRVQVEVAQIESEGERTAKVSAESMGRFARLNIALAELAERHHYNALAISCWTHLQQVFEVVACGSVSRLNQAGIVVSCEADIDGAIGMLMDRAMSGAPASLVDLVSLDEADISLNIWHCGPAPRCMANSAGLQWDEHFDLGHMENQHWCGMGAVASMQFKPGTITVSRVSSRRRDMTVFTGEVFDKPAYQGSSGWVRQFHMQGRPLELRDLLSVI